MLQQRIYGDGIGQQVALAETPWLKHGPVEPFEPHILHPLWRPAVLAREKIEQTAAGLDHRNVGKPVEIARDETLLQRYAEAHPENIGLRCDDIGKDRLLVAGSEITIAPTGKTSRG